MIIQTSKTVSALRIKNLGKELEIAGIRAKYEKGTGDVVRIGRTPFLRASMLSRVMEIKEMKDSGISEQVESAAKLLYDAMRAIEKPGTGPASSNGKFAAGKITEAKGIYDAEMAKAKSLGISNNSEIARALYTLGYSVAEANRKINTACSKN